MLDFIPSSAYEEIERVTFDGYIDFDLLDPEVFKEIQDLLIHPDNSDSAHNVLYEAFSLCVDSGEVTKAMMSFMTDGSLDSAQTLRSMMQWAVDKMTRSEIEKFFKETRQ